MPYVFNPFTGTLDEKDNNAKKIRGVDIDSTVGSPSDGDIIVYRSAGSDWVLEAKPAGGSSPALADITDVTLTSVADNEVLAYDTGSGDWINQTPAEAGLAAASHTHTESDITDLDHYDSSDFDTDLATKDTDDLAEGTNLYFTDERAEDAVGAILTDTSTVDFTYNDGAGTITADVIESALTITESQISDLDHYDSTDFDTDFSGKSTTDLSEGTNLYYTQGRFDTAFSAKDTDDLSEGSTNFYYTETRFDSSLSGKDTGDLTEGSNLYFTDERVDDRVNALLQEGTGITLTYDDGANTLTIDSSGSYTDEDAQDTVASLIQDGTGISWSYDDGSNTLTPTVSLSAFDTGDLSEGSNLYYTDERVDDRVAALIQDGTGIAWTYVDGSNTLTGNVSLSSFDTGDLSEGSNLYFTDERAQDAVGGALVDSSTIDFTYTDGSNQITAVVIESGIDHGSISGLTDDDHTQYALLDGRSGGQTLIGGTGSGDDLTIESTSDSTKGYVNILDQLNVGTDSPDQTTRLFITNTNTATSGNLYSSFASYSYTPTAASSAFVGALGFTVQSNGSQTMTGQIKGVDGIVTHNGTGTLNQALAANYIVKKANTGPLTSGIGINMAAQNTNATGAMDSALLSQFTVQAVGEITTVFGALYNNLGSANTTSSACIVDFGQSGSTTLSAFIYSLGGTSLFNVGQTSHADLQYYGQTDVNLFWVDVSADTVQVGSATASDSAKFYVDGKISTSGELEVNGALNHDGSNVGFYGTAPTTQATGYTTFSNLSTDRSLDADSTTVEELADVLGTLIEDLKATGIISA